MTSVLVPWNTCGAYIPGVLGVPTAAYFPCWTCCMASSASKVPTATAAAEVAAEPEPDAQRQAP